MNQFDSLKVIQEYAKLKRPTKEQKINAIQIHRALSELPSYFYRSQEGLFMREVDTICPDLALRSHYRRQITGE